MLPAASEGFETPWSAGQSPHVIAGRAGVCPAWVVRDEVSHELDPTKRGCKAVAARIVRGNLFQVA